MGARGGKILLDESIMPKANPAHDAAVRYFTDWEHEALPRAALPRSGGLSKGEITSAVQ